jgi:hypothetical protein
MTLTRPLRAGFGGDEAVSDSRQQLVVDRDEFGGVLGGFRRRRDHDRDDLPDMAHLGADDHGLLRPDHRRPVLVLDADVGRVAVGDIRQRVETVGQHIGGGQDGEDARRPVRRRGIDSPDQRMGMRRADHHRIGLSG